MEENYKMALRAASSEKKEKMRRPSSLIRLPDDGR
jgi:hypothetical protein